MNTLATTIFLVSVCLLFPCNVGATGDGTEIPFTLEKGHIIVSAKIRGNIPVEVVLATGGEHSLINANLLEKYKLQASYAGEGIITGSNLDRVVYFVTVPDIRLGEVKINSLYMRFGAQAITQISERVGREVFAILGADFFKGRLVQFDFRKKVIRFMNDKTDYFSQLNANFVSLRMRPASEAVRLPISEDVSINGKKLKTLFDTGALTLISLTPSASKQIGLTPPPDKSPPRNDKLSSLRFGEMEFTDLPVTLNAKGSNFDRDSSGYSAIAGIVLLQNFVVTFDFRNGVIALERI